MDLISSIWIKLSRAPVCTTALGVTGLPGTPVARSCWVPVEVEPPAGVPARTGVRICLIRDRAKPSSARSAGGFTVCGFRATLAKDLEIRKLQKLTVAGVRPRMPCVSSA